MITTITLHNVDARQLHQQILQLEHMQQHLAGTDMATIQETLKLLHHVEDELREQARAQHHH